MRESFKNPAKAAEAEKREAEDAERREKNLEEAKKIVLVEDASLPKSKVGLWGFGQTFLYYLNILFFEYIH